MLSPAVVTPRPYTPTEEQRAFIKSDESALILAGPRTRQDSHGHRGSRRVVAQKAWRQCSVYLVLECCGAADR